MTTSTGQILKVPVQGRNARGPLLSGLAQTGDTTLALSATCHLFPDAGAAATLTVTATDPDGVAAVTATYSTPATSNQVDGPAAKSVGATLTAGAGGVYTGAVGAFTIAGTYPVTISATDKAGHVSTAALNVVIPGCG